MAAFPRVFVHYGLELVIHIVDGWLEHYSLVELEWPKHAILSKWHRVYELYSIFAIQCKFCLPQLFTLLTAYEYWVGVLEILLSFLIC